MLTPTVLLVITAVVGLYMAWTIGANDVANAMGTSVGSKALSHRQAIVVAGILEFAGAVLVGTYVTDTVRKGIVDPQMFTVDPTMLVHGMMAALLAAAVWLHLASSFGWPVSTTHSIVGAVAGFGVAAGGFGALHWSKLGLIVASWLISPLTSGIIAFSIYYAVRRLVIEKADREAEALRHAPLIVAVMTLVLSLVMLFKGLKNLKLKLLWWQSGGVALLLAALASTLTRRFAWRRPARPDAALQGMERIFGSLQVVTAAFVAFAHGANDVANAVGPVAAVFSTLKTGSVLPKVDVPIWILVGGGLGIVLGLATYGYRVMATIGGRITEVTPSRGFAAEFGAALTILVGSKLGLPLSTTHTLVGAVIGVGFARGLRALDLSVIRSIALSWVLTIPFAAGVALMLYYLLRALA